jgi:hypothetical protein
MLPTDDEAQEALSRYTLEFILFRYDDSVSAGTEIFVPPPGAPLEPVYGEVAPADVDLDDASVDLTERGSGAVQYDADEETVPAFGDLEGMGEFDGFDKELEEIVMGPASVELSVLPPEALTLSAVYDTLTRLDAYEPVLWSGWTQIVREQAASPALDLRRLGNVPLTMDGTLTLYLGRFVHLVVDLSLEAEDRRTSPAAAPGYSDSRDYRYDAYGRVDDFRAAEPAVVYRITEDRIMRNGDLRYFDHPKFGLIAKLTLVGEQEPAQRLPPGTDTALPAAEPPAADESAAQ